jgi:hypothetical protein
VNEEVQLSGYQLVGSLLALFDSLPAKNIKAFETALSKDDQRARHLQYLAFTLTSSSHATQVWIDFNHLNFEF